MGKLMIESYNSHMNFFIKDTKESPSIAFSNFCKISKNRLEVLNTIFNIDESLSYVELIEFLYKKCISPQATSKEALVQAYNDAQLFLVSKIMKSLPEIAWTKPRSKDEVSARLRGGYSVDVYDNSPLDIFIGEIYSLSRPLTDYRDLLFNTVEYALQKPLLRSTVIRNIYGANTDLKKSKLSSKERDIASYVVQLNRKNDKLKGVLLIDEDLPISNDPPESLVNKLGPILMNRESISVHKKRAANFSPTKNVQGYFLAKFNRSKIDPRIVDDESLEQLKNFLSWTMINGSGVTNRNYQGLLYFYSQMFASKINLDILSFLKEGEYFKVNSFLDFPKLDSFAKI